MSDFNGNEKLSTLPKRTQVYQATHEGENYLPFMTRSFISFSYGGKNIEDFGLIATVSGDRWEKIGYADFEDLTTTYDVIDGQFYWATSFKTNHFEFELSTDSMTQEQLDEFVRWFKPGQIKELILAEHPNRVIRARVSAAPQISMIPFKMDKEVLLNTYKYTVTTTEYKGSISLSLISDDPFWYAKINIFGSFDIENARKWVNANGEIVTGRFYTDPDILKVIVEDGIPLSSMIQDTMAFGGDIYATCSAELRSCVCTEVTFEEYTSGGGGTAYSEYSSIIENGITKYYKGARVVKNNETVPENIRGVVAGALMSDIGNIDYINNMNDSTMNEVYFYYSGTAPSPLKLTFTFHPIINGESYFITGPYNKFSQEEHPYNTIYIESQTKSQLHLTIPNFYTSYNQVINMFETQIGKSWVEIRQLIRDTVHHSIVRAWANKIIDEIQDTTCTNENSEVAKEEMSKLFIDPSNSTAVLPCTVEIDSKTGEAIGTFNYRWEDEEDPGNYIVETIIESVQDMCVSNNLYIVDRNFPDSNGQIVKYRNNTATTKSYSHRLYHDFPMKLYDVHISYENLYL